jgi:hypothetical protein
MPCGLRSRDCKKPFLMSRWRYRRREFRAIGPRQATDASPFGMQTRRSVTSCSVRPTILIELCRSASLAALRARSLIVRGISVVSCSKLARLYWLTGATSHVCAPVETKASAPFDEVGIHHRMTDVHARSADHARRRIPSSFNVCLADRRGAQSGSWDLNER